MKPNHDFGLLTLQGNYEKDLHFANTWTWFVSTPLLSFKIGTSLNKKQNKFQDSL